MWEVVQDVINGRHLKRRKKSKPAFAFSGLITCGHCGCSLVAEIKKERYIYYHCTGHKGKCPEPYTREESLEEQFSQVLEQLTFDEEVFSWVKRALKESHVDKKAFHNKEIARLQAECTKINNRIDIMYMDKLDGLIDTEYFEGKVTMWRGYLDRLHREMDEHNNANNSYFDEGIRIIELARKATSLFRKQSPQEKRKMLNFLVSNCTWKDGELEVIYRQPFDIIAKTAKEHNEKETAETVSDGQFANWLPLAI